jgi:PTS system N-acetylgalactosamine-specific IIA component
MTTSSGDDGSPGPVAVVAAHGDLAAGLVSAVAQITGRGDLLVPLSNRGLGAADLELALRDALAGGTIRAVFTDLPGGSWTMAARRVQRDRPALALAAGVNLAALLDYVCAAGAELDAGRAPAEDDGGDAARAAVARAVERGRAALVAPAAPPVPDPKAG